MISTFSYNRWGILKFLIGLSILIPLSIVTYQILFLGKNSVVFLEGYPTALSIGVLCYYGLILLCAVIWLVIQLKELIILKNEKKVNELLHLQNQVNPHFFFNMLNNLYGMVGRDTDKAKGLILKLSELMRYSIYEGEKHRVKLTEELTYLENFIALNQMRYHKKVNIEFDVEVENENFKIMPLLFIILVENAFKHGVEKLQEDAFVHINLKASDSIIDFEISNNFDATELEENHGIGLKNLKRRLELAYPQRHKFSSSKEDAIFKAKLQLKQ